MSRQPNIVIILADQLRAQSVSPSERQVAMPGLEGLADEGMRCTHALSTCPLCTPYRGMFMTGRHPQTTGMIVNFTSTRYSEIGLGDAFAHAGYHTGYVGKWHLNRGAYPSESRDFIPQGRARLGFDYWRAYNCHVDFWDGHVNGEDWDCQRWQGYETVGLMEYVREFLSQADDRPWLLVVSPHQPHWNRAELCAPQEYYDRLPTDLEVPANVPDHYRAEARRTYRHYLAMTLAVDDMVQHIRRLVGPDTLVIFTSDHGTQMGGAAYEGEKGNCWGKCRPQEESVLIPFFACWPGRIAPGGVCDELLTPVDVFPTLCGLAGVPVPRTVEGLDLSAAFLGKTPRQRRQSALLMSFNNYTYSPNLIRQDGKEWRGLRTHRYTYVQWREGERQLFDRERDPGQIVNFSGRPEYADLEAGLAAELRRLLDERGDDLHPYGCYRDWIDQERRIIRNAWGPFSHPDEPPDWSLLR